MSLEFERKYVVKSVKREIVDRSVTACISCSKPLEHEVGKIVYRVRIQEAEAGLRNRRQWRTTSYFDLCEACGDSIFSALSDE